MKKSDVLDALIGALDAELQKMVAASRDAADYATNEEARAESQWDTQGLEASYLAAGQAEQARHLAEGIELLQVSRHRLLQPANDVSLGALIRCEIGGQAELFFVAPAGGGEVLAVDGSEVTVVTLQSPLLSRILGQRPGAGFTLANGVAGAVLAVE
jgi:hypothetical protein